tara:strand:+ start:1563 stop:3872 length:2310 start_codon:yes stop_codon:yes gene_type:complete
MSDMVIRIILFIFLFASPLFADCKNTNDLLESKIENIKIEFNKEKKFITKVSKHYIHYKEVTSSKKSINKKKRHKAKIIINYDTGNSCSYKARIRMHGDGIDHIKLINGTPTSSLNIILEEGNIKNIRRFILFLPNSRNFDNEIFVTTLFSHLNFLSPRTFKIKANVHNNNVDYIFQESLKKEFLEYNNKIEGPILESNEDMEQSNLEMSRVSNTEWIKNNKNKYHISLNSIKDYNLSLLKSYQFRIIAGDETVRLDRQDFTKKEFKKISTFDALMYGLGGAHGLSYDDRRFYYDPVYSILEPIYYDGDSNILSKINYDIVLGKFKNKLDPWKIIKEPYLDLYSNLERDPKNRNRNPTVTYSAKHGAYSAIELLNSIDTELLLSELIINDFNTISLEKLDKLIDHIIYRLELISKASVYDKMIELDKSIYSKHEDKMKLNENLNLIFQKNEFSSFINYEVEECNYKLTICKNYLINEKKLKKLLEQKKINSKKSVFINFTKENYKEANITKSKNSIKSNFRKIQISDFFKIYINKDVQVFLDRKNKKINLNYFSNLGRSIIMDSNIDAWTITMNNLAKNKNEEFNNIYNLTGCLTLIDSFINKINISGDNFKCEDTVNFIRSKGSINNLNINNAKFDSLDADFSQLKFKNVKIKNSGNDCFDLSYGIYDMESLYLQECADKSVSIGEKSTTTIDNLIAKNSNMGIAVKDSSKVIINNALMNNLNICLNVYNKKQEFNGGFLKVKNFTCKNSENKINKDEKSILIVENEL